MADRVGDVQQRTLTLLERQLELAERKTNPQHITAISRAVATLTAEMRKRESHAREFVAALPSEERDQLVQVYLESLPRERRRLLLEKLQELDSKETLLG